MNRLYNILNKLADYAGIESGTDNGWTYRKYADGTYDAWRTYQATGLSLTKSSGGTYYGDSGYRDLAPPSFSLSIMATLATAKPSLSSGIFVYTADPYAGNVRINYRSHVSNNDAACGTNLRIIGTWK